MPQVPLIAVEILLGFGAPLAWAAWELVSLRREQARDREREARLPAPEAPAPAPNDDLEPR